MADRGCKREEGMIGVGDRVPVWEDEKFGRWMVAIVVYSVNISDTTELDT